jgi:hypothetical protein
MSATEATALQADRLNHFEQRLCSLDNSLMQSAPINAKSALLKLGKELGFVKSPTFADVIRDETSKLLSNIDLMVEHIASFEDLKGLHESYEKEKERLPKLFTQYQAECKRQEEEVRTISRSLESLRLNLDKNPTWDDFVKLEK